MRNRIIYLIALLLVMAACSGNKTIKRSGRPQWLDNPQQAYPSQTYLTAIGTGSSRDSAEKDAAAKLSRIFRTEIKATETIEKRYEELTKGKETQIEDHTQSLKNVTLSSEEELVNIQYGESYTDDNARVHVIAYINRYQTGSIYEEMISLNTGQIIKYNRKSHELTDPLDCYAYAGAAFAIAQKNDDLIRQYRIISPEMSSMYEPGYELDKIRADHIAAAREVTFSINLAESTPERLASLLSRILTSEGFQTVKDDGYIQVNAFLDMSKTDLNRDDGTIFYRWNLDISLVKPDGRTILSLNPSGRSGSVSESEAQSRVFIDVEKKLDKDLARQLNAWFDNIVIKEN